MPKTKSTKQTEAQARQVVREKRSTLDQAEALAKRPGDSKRERTRLGLYCLGLYF